MPKRRASLPNATKESPAKKANTEIKLKPVIELTQQNIPTSTNIVPDYDPLIAINQAEEEEEEEEREEIENFRILDTLAWLLETNTSDCVALTVVEVESGNCRLLIATNSINDSSRKKSKLISNLHLTILDLSKIASGKMDKNQEKNLAKRIYESKLRLAYKGSLATPLSENDISLLKNLIDEAYQNSENSRKIPQISIDEKIINFKKSRIQISGAIELANRTLRRLYRFKAHILNEKKLRKSLIAINDNIMTKNNEPNFIKFNKFGSMNIKDALRLTREKAREYVIIATHSKGDIVHAETKILDFLMAARLIDSKKTGIYDIGISKKSCPTCNLTYQESQKIIPSELMTAKSHQIKFEAWGIPLFLQEKTEKRNRHCLKSFGYIHLKTKDTEEFIPISSFEDYDRKIKEIHPEDSKVIGAYLNRDQKMVKKISQAFYQKYTSLEKITPNDGCMSHSSPEKPKEKRNNEERENKTPTDPKVRKLSEAFTSIFKEMTDKTDEEVNTFAILGAKELMKLASLHGFFSKKNNSPEGTIETAQKGSYNQP